MMGKKKKKWVKKWEKHEGYVMEAVRTLTSRMLVMDALGADALSRQGDEALVPVLAKASSLLKLKNTRPFIHRLVVVVVEVVV